MSRPRQRTDLDRRCEQLMIGAVMAIPVPRDFLEHLLVEIDRRLASTKIERMHTFRTPRQLKAFRIFVEAALVYERACAVAVDALIRSS